MRVWCAINNLGLSLFLSFVHTASTFRRVCYFTNWSRDLQEAGARFRLTDVEPHLCTHLVYAFAAVQPHNSSLAPVVTHLAEGPKEELERYRRFNALKKVNVQLKTLLSVGGSFQTNGDFVEIVSSESNRKQFANNVLLHLRIWGFDGLDIDWEFPGNPPDTKPNFVLLLRELRRVFQAEALSRKVVPLLLSVAAPVSQDQMTAGYAIPEVSSLVDFINLMAYDFHGSWNSVTSFNSPLHSRDGDPRFSPQLSVTWATQRWLQQGADPQKLVLGVAGYGQSFTLRDPGQHGVGAPTSGPGNAGRWRHMSGQLTYYEVCELVRAGGTEAWDNLQHVPYVHLHDQWVGYDNPHSVQDKVAFALEHSLGGVMFWSLDMDDFRGAFCGQGRYPLLTAIVTAISQKLPGVSVRMMDAVTWAHPDSRTSRPTQPKIKPTTFKNPEFSFSRSSSAPNRVSSKPRPVWPSRVENVTNEVVVLINEEAPASTNGGAPRDRSTGNESRGSTLKQHTSCRVLLKSALVLLFVLVC